MSCSVYQNGEAFARTLDQTDQFAALRDEFRIPTVKEIKQQLGEEIKSKDDQKATYLCGNSLGLLPRNAVNYVNREFDKWGRLGVLGHEHGELPWVSCENFARDILSDILGCQANEVVVMNNLTSNIHLLLSSFYRPSTSRFKLAIEGDAFPSDHYAMECHAQMHGFDPTEALVVFRPRLGEDLLRIDDIIARIEEEGEKLSVIFMSAIHFRTGQYYDIARIVEAGHKVGALVGIDLAHAIGNVPLYLDQWKVDFACACTYKYLNAGAGGIGVCYVNAAHFKRQPRLIGWFAHKLDTRFVMDNKLDLEEDAAGFKTGNQSPILCAALVASLEIFKKAGGIAALRKKSLLLTGYLEWLLTQSEIFSDLAQSNLKPHIITPHDPQQRGCQISIRISGPPGAVKIGEELEKRGVICDIRRPDIVRVAPTPLYNSFEDVYNFAIIFRDVLKFFLHQQ